MSLRIVQLGTPRHPGEGLRIGTVRRLPRGVPKVEYAARDYFDTWLPNLAPSAELMQWAREVPLTGARLAAFRKQFRAEMERPENKHVLALIAVLSRHTDLAVGCYCEEESQCHRQVLRELLAELGANITD